MAHALVSLLFAFELIILRNDLIDLSIFTHSHLQLLERLFFWFTRYLIAIWDLLDAIIVVNLRIFVIRLPILHRVQIVRLRLGTHRLLGDFLLFTAEAVHSCADPSTHSAALGLVRRVNIQIFIILIQTIFFLRHYQRRRNQQDPALFFLLFTEAASQKLVEFRLESFVGIN